MINYSHSIYLSIHDISFTNSYVIECTYRTHTYIFVCKKLIKKKKRKTTTSKKWFDVFCRSSEDLSPNFVDRNVSFYDRNTRLNDSSDGYIRRPNNYHQNDARGRLRDRHYRNGSYSSVVDRSVYTQTLSRSK